MEGTVVSSGKKRAFQIAALPLRGQGLQCSQSPAFAPQRLGCRPGAAAARIGNLKSSAGASPPRRSQFRIASAMVARISIRSRSASPVTASHPGSRRPSLASEFLAVGSSRHCSRRTEAFGRCVPRRARISFSSVMAHGQQDISYRRALSLRFFWDHGAQGTKVACLHFLNKKV